LLPPQHLPGPDGPPLRGGLGVIPASQIAPKPYEWAWDGRIPLGGTTLVTGRVGTGKTMLVLDLLAKASRGELEGDLHGTPVASIFATTEDSLASVVRPRLEAAGADLTLVHLFDASGFVLPRDLDKLGAAMQACDARLLALDPLGSFLRGVTNEAVRGALEPLGAAMDRLGAACIGIAHVTKARQAVAVDRALGSRAYSAVARSILAVEEEASNPGQQLVVPVKLSGQSLAVPILRFTVSERIVRGLLGEIYPTGGIEWMGVADDVCRADLFATPAAAAERSAKDEIGDLLAELLADGPLPRADALRIVRAAGIDASSRTFRRACLSKGIRQTQRGGGRAIEFWIELPDIGIDDSPSPPSAQRGAQDAHLADVLVMTSPLQHEQVDLDTFVATVGSAGREADCMDGIDQDLEEYLGHLQCSGMPSIDDCEPG